MKKNKLGLGAEPAKQRAPLSSDESKPSKRRSLKDPFSDPKNEDVGFFNPSRYFINSFLTNKSSVD